jgi:ribonuclease BN (tRNA processing enzyme)
MLYELLFLGSGGGLVSTKENYHSNMLFRRIYEDERIYEPSIATLAIDCGTHWQAAIEELNISLFDIHSIFITHQHADHINSLEYIGFKTYFNSFPFGKEKRELIGNIEVLEAVWNECLGAMKSLQGQTNKLETFFNPIYVPPNGSFKWYDIDFNLVQTVHIVDDRRIVPSYGLMFKPDTKKIFITGDTQFAPHALFTYYDQADIIFHDCELKNYRGSVHAQYHELATLPKEVKDKMWLYHYTMDGAELPNAEEDGFRGFVKKGQVFNLN